MKIKSMHKIKKRHLLLGVSAIIVIFLLFCVFLGMNRYYIIKQNTNYIQDNAEMKAAQLDKSFSESMNHMEMLTYWFGTTLDSPVITAEQLKELEANCEFDYVRFADASGVNMAADGRTNDARDRDYYINGMADKALADIPIIAMTATAFDEDRKQAKEAGMDGLVVKPLDTKELWSVLATIMHIESGDER